MREKGPNPVPVSDSEIEIIMNARHWNPDADAIAIESYLLETEMAMEYLKRRSRRNGYDTREKLSNSLWHMVWSYYEVEQLMVIEDVASRFMASFGSFASATTENTLLVLRKAIEEHGTPREIIWQTMLQFFSNGKKEELLIPTSFRDT